MMARDLALEREIRQGLDAVRIIDTHEHLDSEEEFQRGPADFGRLFSHYANCDLISAGCPPQDMERVISDRQLGPRDKWQLMAPYWERIRDTGYARCLDTAIRDLYGLDGLTADTVEPLSARMDANRRPGYYREVFDKAGIEVALWNRLDRFGPLPRLWTREYDRSLFVQDVLCDFLFENPDWRERWGREILCLDDYLGAIEERFVAHASQANALEISLDKK